MIAAAQDGFIGQRRLPERRFYSDAFVQSGSAPDIDTNKESGGQ